MTLGAEPWRFPHASDLGEIHPPKTKEGEEYVPYERDKNLVRKWAVPGQKGLMHRVGGLEKEDLTGNVSYDPENHEKMVQLRAAKVAKIQEAIPKQSFELGGM